MSDQPANTTTEIESLLCEGRKLSLSDRDSEAEPYFQRATELAEALDAGACCEVFCAYGSWLVNQGLERSAEAEPYFRRAAELAETLDASARCTAFTEYGGLLTSKGRTADAEPYLHRAAELAETLDARIRCKAFSEYGTLLRLQWRSAEAEPYLRRAAELAETLDTITRCEAFLSYGAWLSAEGRKVVAEPHLWLKELGENFNLWSEGRSAEAESYLRRAAELAETLDTVTRFNALRVFGQFLRDRDRDAEAEPYLCQAAGLAETLGAFARCTAFTEYGSLLAYEGRSAEAEPYLRHAAELAETLDVQHVRFPALRSYGHLLFQLGRYTEAVQLHRMAQIELGQCLSDNRFPMAIRAFLHEHSVIYEYGLLASHNLLLSEPDANTDCTFSGSEFVDGNKAVWVRESLAQLAHLPTGQSAADAWEPLARDWSEIVSRPTDGPGTGHRGVRESESSSAPAVIVSELPAPLRTADRPLIGPILRDELVAFLADHAAGANPDTVYISFDFVNLDLYVLPLRCGSDGRPREIRTREGYFVLEGVWMEVDHMAQKWRSAIKELLKTSAPTTAVRLAPQSSPPLLLTLPADELRRELSVLSDCDPEHEGATVANRLRPMVSEWPDDSEPSTVTPRPPARLLAELGHTLRLDAMLELVEPDRTKWSRLHLVFLPDVQLYQLPLHAAWVDSTACALIDTVASVRYALSLRTLHTLQVIERQQAEKWPDGVPLRGSLFANPTGKGIEYRYTDDAAGVTDEVENVIDKMGSDVWRVFGDIGYDSTRHATRENFERELPNATLLWAACHGGLMTDESFDPEPIASPSLLLCDGPLSSARMVADGFDFRGCWLFHASCCLLAQLESEDADRQAEGFIAAMMLRGCRRVSGAMWELADGAAAEFAGHYAAALQRNVFGRADRDPNAVALSLKEAVVALRKVDNGRFDHEFFWAAFALYGLG